MNYFYRKIYLFFMLSSFIVFLSVFLSVPLFAIEDTEGFLSPKELIIRAWESWGAKDIERTFYYTDKCIKSYSEEAKTEQVSLKGFPSTDSINRFETLNAVGTSYFIQGEAYL